MRKRITIHYTNGTDFTTTDENILEAFEYGEHGIEWEVENEEGVFHHFYPYCMISSVITESGR